MSNGKNIKSPLRYAGGKNRATKHLIKYLPKNIHEQKVISPFFGGGSFEFYLNSLGCEVKGYDIFDLLVNYWQIQLKNGKEIANILENYENNKSFYMKHKEIVKDHFTGKKIITDRIQLAADYFYSHNCSYGPMFLGWWSSIYDDRKKYDSMVDRVRNFKPNKISVHCKPFSQSLKNTGESFIYLDPPYFLNNDKMQIGLYPNRNFPIHHKGFDHEDLAKMVRKHKGLFMLSYNDCEEVKDLYKGYYFYYPKWNYSMGNGETRVGKFRKEGNRDNNIKESHEIVITNYEVIGDTEDIYCLFE